MSGDPDPRFIMRNVTPTEWVVNDRRYQPDDPRHVVASVYELAETDVEVVWVRQLPAASRYSSPAEVLEEIERLQKAGRATRPIPIPHLPPLLST